MSKSSALTLYVSFTILNAFLFFYLNQIIWRTWYMIQLESTVVKWKLVLYSKYLPVYKISNLWQNRKYSRASWASIIINL